MAYYRAEIYTGDILNVKLAKFFDIGFWFAPPPVAGSIRLNVTVYTGDVLNTKETKLFPTTGIVSAIFRKTEKYTGDVLNTKTARLLPTTGLIPKLWKTVKSLLYSFKIRGT